MIKRTPAELRVLVVAHLGASRAWTSLHTLRTDLAQREHHDHLLAVVRQLIKECAIETRGGEVGTFEVRLAETPK
jgi:hypothetical protein